MNYNAAHRIPQRSPLCSICDDYEETIIHAMFRCPWADRTWQDSRLPMLHEAAIANTMEDFLGMVRLKLSEKEMRLLWVVVWRVWYVRNSVVFRGKEASYLGIIPYC
ncbi:hypothetical protein CFOL_v3_20325 [Cephalotus follicularis]|uniref:Uncharacterized protein n=1 Tax=Cephalotus follicularis TaxID=3775 RepID=A0A1Q3C9Q2_CEPFO|nr:hypothetical protein CFOL_v3_20325 [Cephalotus follicularis]